MRVLGIDPGLTRLGVGVVDMTPGRQAVLVHVEVLRTSASDELPQRLLHHRLGLERIVTEFHPDRAGLERVFAHNNRNTVMGVAQVSGIAMALCAEHGIPIDMPTPSEMKNAITGFGGAEKPQIGAMVARVLGLKEAPKPADAADALAIAITCGWKAPFRTAAASGARQTGGRSGERSGAMAGAGSTPALEKWRDAERKARGRF